MRRCQTNIPPLTEELAYVCGFLMGDGSISIREEKHDHCIKAVGNPRDEREFYDIVIKDLFWELFHIPLKTRLFDQGTTYGFQFTSKRLVGFLTGTMGLPPSPKQGKLRIPPSILADEGLLRACVRGIFDTDGCVSFKKRNKDDPYYPVVSISSSSSVFISQLHRSLRRLGLDAYVVLDYHVRDARLLRGHSLISRVELSGQEKLKEWLRIIGTWHPRHQRKIMSHGSDDVRELMRKNIAGAGLSETNNRVVQSI